MTVRTGVVGVGSMGENHARVYAELPGVELIGVCDADADRAAAVAAEYGTEALSADELRRRADAVSVAVPTAYHAPVVRRCIDAGVDVLVEKPFVDDAETGRELARRARDAGVTLQVGHVERFNPAVTALSDILPGLDVIAVSARRLGPPVARDISDGVVSDLMIHDLDVVRSLIDADVTDVSAVAPDRGDHVTATLSFANGTVADLTASRVTQRKVRRLDVVAAECLVTVDYLDQSVEIHRSSVPEYVREDGDLRYRHEGVVERPLIDSREPLKCELESFVAAASGDEPPRVSPDDALAALELVWDIEAELDAGVDAVAAEQR